MRIPKWRVVVLTALGGLIALALAGTAAASVTLSASSTSLAVTQTVTLTASPTNQAGAPAPPGNHVTFTVISGPNAGLTQQTVTDSDGNAVFEYSSSTTGTDDIRASWSEGEEISNQVSVTWTPPPQITLAPTSSTLRVGQTVTMTANVTLATGGPAEGRNVTFTVTSGPNAGLTDKGVTDANGNASFSYSSSTTGTDVVTASWLNGESTETSNDATVTWSPPSITLAPTSSTLLVGQPVTLTANVTLATGGPAEDRNVTFTVTSGPNAGLTDKGVTDANGNASFSYSSSTTGTDVVTASWLNGESTDTSNDATVTWSAPPPATPAKTDVGIALTAPSLVRAGDTGTWTATVTNAGPDTATGVVVSASAPSSATFVSATESAGDGCTGSNCRVGTLAKGATVTVTLVYRLAQPGSIPVATSVTGDFDTNPANNSASAAATVAGANTLPPPPPTQPGTFNAIGTGTVLVNGASRPADQLFVLNSGDTVDVTNGVMTFTASDGSTASFSSTQPTARRVASAGRAAASLPAQFTVSQETGSPTTVTLVGGDFAACGSARSLAAVKKPIRGLWGSAKGNFRTTGRFSAATIRGTIWLVQDRCDGTLTQVVEGTVSVRDTVRNKTVSVTAGSSYLAKSPLKIAAQTVAVVLKRGLRYDGKLFKTKKALDLYLRRSGYAWAEFALHYPKLAKALAKRK